MDPLQLGRDAFERRSWTEAFEVLAAASPDHPDDLERLAVAAALVGRDDDSERAWEQAISSYVKGDDRASAARCAFWVAMARFLRGDEAGFSGWAARAERLARDAGECAAAGLVLTPPFMATLEAGDPDTARRMASEMISMAQRLDDRELLALGLLCTGEAEYLAADIEAARKAIDEAMVVVTTNEVPPLMCGIVYCGVVEACMRAGDLHRAVQWTDALERFCAEQPDLVPFRGSCLIHRSQVHTAHGNWQSAAAAVDMACDRLAEPPHPAIGLALYQRGELHRLRGEHAEAETVYKDAGRHGMDPVPGLALVRLAQGDVAAASAMARRMVAEVRGGGPIAALVLAPAIEIFVATGDLDDALSIATRLVQHAEHWDLPLVQATVSHASGLIHLATADPAAALSDFRRACNLWHALEVPYDEARARVGLAHSCAALGDLDGRANELDVARATFSRLGAIHDLRAVDRVPAPSNDDGPLTQREREVLRLVATGLTNREVADVLSISEHTVARHLQNMFLKLGLTSRSAATAYAYEHGIVAPRG